MAAVASVAVLPPSLSAQIGADEHAWLDAHSHIWTRYVENFPLANGRAVDDLAPPNFTAEELLDVAHTSGVGRVVLI